jgi:hypothetical protein
MSNLVSQAWQAYILANMGVTLNATARDDRFGSTDRHNEGSLFAVVKSSYLQRASRTVVYSCPLPFKLFLSKRLPFRQDKTRHDNSISVDDPCSERSKLDPDLAGL